MAVGIELLKQIFSNDEVHIAIGKISTVTVSADRSAVRCLVAIWPDQLEVIATMTWEKVSDGGGDYQIPEPEDMVLVAFAYGKRDYAYILKSLSSKDDRVPANAASGDRIVKARVDKTLWLTSDTRINLSKTDTAPTEPLVLGNVLKTLLGNILLELKTLSTALSTHTHTSSGSGMPTLATPYTDAATAFNSLKANSVDNNSINSDLAFTEKG